MTDRTKYAGIIGRAIASGYMDGIDVAEAMMDIESADKMDDFFKVNGN